MPPRYVLVANPGSKRCELYRRELAAFWAARGEVVDAEVVPWAEVVPRDGNLDDIPAFDRPAVVRLESPGKDVHVTQLMLAAGARDDPNEPPRDWGALDLPHGVLVRPGLWFRGFAWVLRGLERSFDARPHLTPTACPLAVAEMFDKNATLAKLRAAGVPVPDWLPPDRFPAGANAFHHAVRASGWPVVYTKLNTGASAVGLVVSYYPHNRVSWGLTTLFAAGGEFFSTRHLRRVDSFGHDACFRFLFREGATVQRGIPLVQVHGENFDVRVVCVHGAPVATICRVSPHPVTNLHLGGRRGDPAACRAAVGSRAWLDGLDLAAAAAGCFDATIAGVDILFERGSGRPYVLEVNAFGDFFPGWVDARGRSVHALEFGATARRAGE